LQIDHAVLLDHCIFVRWFDSGLRGGWVYDIKEPTPKEIESVGFVCAASEEALTITCGRCESGGVIAPLTIPSGCIIEYKILDIQ